MNERIQELYLHAFAPSISDSAVCKEGAKKFAELIVRECMSVAEENQAPDVDWNVSDIIRVHFGVDE